MIFLEKYTFSKEKLLFKVASKVNTIKKLGFVIIDYSYTNESVNLKLAKQKHYLISDFVSSSFFSKHYANASGPFSVATSINGSLVHRTVFHHKTHTSCKKQKYTDANNIKKVINDKVYTLYQNGSIGTSLDPTDSVYTCSYPF